MSPVGPFLLLDQGSTATKAALVEADGTVLREHSVAVATRSHGDRVEHDAEALLAGVEEALEHCARGARPAALALATQRSTCLLWEREGGAALTPARSWRDRAAAGETAARASSAGIVAQISGLRLSPHYAAPKLAQMLAAAPELRRRAGSGEVVAGTLDGWLVHRLTGTPSTEPGQAGRTLLHDLEGDRWNRTLLELWGLPAAAMPELLPSDALRGDWRGVPLRGLLGDQQAALLGHGGWNPGGVAAHFGTGAFVLAGTGERILRHPGLLTAALATLQTAPAGVRHFQIEGSIHGAGAALDPVVREAGIDLDSWRRRPLPDAGAPLVLAAVDGVGAPWWRSELSGLYGERTPLPEGEELLSALLQGLAHRIADVLEAMAAAGLASAAVRVSGKLTRLAGFVQRVADLSGLPVAVAGAEEAGLAGLLRLLRGSPADPPPAPVRMRQPAWSDAQRQAERGRWRELLAAIPAT